MAAAPARSTACIESKNHQKSLTNCAKALIGAMKTHQSVKVYDEYLTDIKSIIEPQIADLNSRTADTVVPQIIKTIRDPLCKFLQPASTSDSELDEDFPDPTKRPDYDDIYDAFPAGKLTEEVRDQISLAYEHMQNSYEEAAKGMKICKKLSQTLPAGPLKMLMYSMIQPVIRMKGPRRRVDQVEKRSIMNSVPEPAQAIRLPVPVKILAAVGAYYFKLEYGLKVSIKKNAELYDVPEKKFRECIKGVKYDSGSQAATKKSLKTMPSQFKKQKRRIQEQQESSEDKTDDDDETEDPTDNSSSSDEDETLAKIRPLKRKKQKGNTSKKK